MDFSVWIIQCGLGGSFLEETLIKSCLCQAKETRTNIKQKEKTVTVMCNSGRCWRERILWVATGQGHSKARATWEGFLEEGTLSSLFSQPPLAHFFIHTFTKCLLRAEGGITSQIHWHYDLGHGNGCYYFIRHHGNKMRIGTESSGKVSLSLGVKHFSTLYSVLLFRVRTHIY